MTRTRGFIVPFATWFVAAGIPVAILGCQNEGRSDATQGATALAASAASGQPSGARLDDTTKTNILLRQIHAANQEEIELGKLAQDKAQNAEVKKFATEMVNDHSAADQKLTDLAKRTNIELAATPHDPVEQALQSASDESKRTLRSMSGSQFDVAYIAPQVDMHIFALKLVEEAGKTASGDTKKLLDEMRPTVESHLDHAKTLMRDLTFSPAAVGGGPMGGEGAPMGSAHGAMGKSDGGHREEPHKGTKQNP